MLPRRARSPLAAAALVLQLTSGSSLADGMPDRSKEAHNRGEERSAVPGGGVAVPAEPPSGGGEGTVDDDAPPPPVDDARERSSRRRLLPAPGPTPVQTYFVPLPEDDMATFIFDGVSPSDLSADPVRSLTTIAVAMYGTVIWYDHWEDGYEDDVTDPVQASTQIWGDGDFANGCVEAILKRMEPVPVYDHVCTASDADVVTGAMALLLREENAIAVPRDANDVYFDGRDLIQSSFPVGVTRGGYPDGVGLDLGGAVEVFESAHFGKFFYTVVGQDDPFAAGQQAYDLTQLHVIAAEDDTEITFDGTVVATIDRGHSYVQDNVNEGLVLQATKDVQVTFVMGDRDSSDHEMRWSALLPFDDWSSEYYVPVNSDATAENWIWIYNPPDNAMITLHVEDTVGGDINFAFPSGATGFNAYIPAKTYASAIRVYTAGGETFHVMMMADMQNPTAAEGGEHDWGHALIGTEFLTSRAVVGWGHGCIDNSCGGGGSRSVVWITTVADADVHVDYNGDGTFDNTFNCPRLNQVLVEDSADDDMTGAVIFANDTTTGAEVKMAVAWGQKPALATPTDGLDMGTAVMPITDFAVGAVISLESDLGPLQLDTVSPGDTLRVILRFTYIGIADLPAGAFNVIADFSPIFDQTDYVAGSTEYYDELGNPAAVPDDIMPATAFPLDVGGVPTQFTLKRDGTAHQVAFLVTVKDETVITHPMIQARGHISSTPIFPFYAQHLIRFISQINVVVAAYANHDGGASCDAAHDDKLASPAGGGDLLRVPLGAPVTYCYVVTNTGNSFFDHSVGPPALTDAFGSDWVVLGGPALTAPGEKVTLYVERTAGAVNGDAVTNAVTVGGTASLHNRYPLEPAASTSDPDIITVESVDYAIDNLDHCESFSHDVTAPTQIMHFEFLANTLGCVNVRVFLNSRDLLQTEKDGGVLNDDWNVMCHAHVQGMGSSLATLTDIPPEYCVPTVVQAGATVYFHVAVLVVAQSICDALPTASGINYSTLVDVDTDGADLCAAYGG